MNRNTITLLIALALGGLTFWLIHRQGSGTIPPALRDFAVTDTASITKIFLADKAQKQVTLTKESDGRWKVDGKYYARPDAIQILLVTIHDVSVREPVSNKAKDNVIKALATGGTKCEIYAGDKLIKQYYVGQETQDMMGTYMLLSDISDPDDIVNSSEPFIMEIKGFNGYLTTRYFTKETEWRDRNVFRYFVPNIRSIKIEHKGQPEQSFVVTQSSSEKGFGLQNLSGQPLPFDTVAVKQFISYFGNIGFENFVTDLPKPEMDSILHSTPEHIITITDDANRKNEIKMFLKKGDGTEDTTGNVQPYDVDRMYAQINNGQDFVIVQYYVFGKLLETPEYFLPRKIVMPKKK